MHQSQTKTFLQFSKIAMKDVAVFVLGVATAGLVVYLLYGLVLFLP